MRRGLSTARRNPALVCFVSAGIVLLAVLAGCGTGGDDETANQEKPQSLVPAGVTAAAVDSVPEGAESMYEAGTLSAGQGVSAEVAPAGQIPAAKLKPVQKETPIGAEDPSGAHLTRPATSASVDHDAYNLQLGSFTNLDNARRQADRISALGYRAVIEASELGGQTYHRVMLKGVGDMAEASRLGEHIHSELGIAYLVRRAP